MSKMRPLQFPDAPSYQQPAKPSPSRIHVLVLWLFPTIATCLVLWSAFYARFPPRAHSPTPSRWTTCGSSPTRARARGCRFDILSFAWQTAECYDDDLMQEFIRYDNWTFYAHFNSTETVVDTAIALEGNRGLYVDWKYHITHCTFMWRQMYRAYSLRGYIDSHLDNYNHTLHCQRTMLERDTPLESVVVVGALKYPECRKISGVDGETTQLPLAAGGGAYVL